MIRANAHEAGRRDEGMIKRKGMRVVAYYRVSTDRQGRSGLGIDAQRAAVQGLIEASGGWPPVAEFTETESGRKVDRKQLAAALAACRVHRAVLVIAKLDRLSRNQSFLMALIDSGVDVLFCDLPEIPAGAMGRFMLQQMSAVAELEAGLISERTKAALAAKVARDGQWDRNAKHHLVAGVGQKAATEAVRARAAQKASDLAPIIAEIRKAGADSLREIAKALTERGIPQPSGGMGAWSAVQVSRTMARL